MYSQQSAGLYAKMSRQFIEDEQLKSDPSDNFITNMKSQMKAYEFLATCNDMDIEWLFNSGAFAKLCVKYCEKAMAREEITEEKRKKVLSKLEMELDSLYLS